MKCIDISGMIMCLAYLRSVDRWCRARRHGPVATQRRSTSTEQLFCANGVASTSKRRERSPLAPRASPPPTTVLPTPLFRVLSHVLPPFSRTPLPVLIPPTGLHPLPPLFPTSSRCLRLAVTLLEAATPAAHARGFFPLSDEILLVELSELGKKRSEGKGRKIQKGVGWRGWRSGGRRFLKKKKKGKKRNVCPLSSCPPHRLPRPLLLFLFFRYFLRACFFFSLIPFSLILLIINRAIFFFFGSCHVSKYISQKRIVKLPTLLSPSLKFNSMNLLFAWAPGSGRDFRQAFVACQRVVETRIRNNSLQFYCFCFPASYFFFLLLLLFLPFIPLYPPLWRLYAHATSIYEM